MVNPIKPDEIAKRKAHQIPDEVIEAFNDLIVQNFNGRSATVKQEDVIEDILHRTRNSSIRLPMSREQIFLYKYLDVEEVFRRVGWKVTFDKPMRGDNYDAFFKFEK